MTDWIDEAEKACEAASKLDHSGEYNATMAHIARTALPRALAVIWAADELIEAAEVLSHYKEPEEGQRWLVKVSMSERAMEKIEEALVSYRKARHADTS